MKVFLEAFDSVKPAGRQHPLRTHIDYADFDALPEVVTDDFGFDYQKAESPDSEGWILYHHTGNESCEAVQTAFVEPFYTTITKFFGFEGDDPADYWKNG